VTFPLGAAALGPEPLGGLGIGDRPVQAAG
jgi:hypothetical protein